VLVDWAALEPYLRGQLVSASHCCTVGRLYIDENRQSLPFNYRGDCFAPGARSAAVLFERSEGYEELLRVAS